MLCLRLGVDIGQPLHASLAFLFVFGWLDSQGTAKIRPDLYPHGLRLRLSAGL